MILITGRSTLAGELAKNLNDCIIVGKPDYDFSLKADCDRLIDNYPTPNVIINTFASIDTDEWDSLTTNYTAPVYLTCKYYDKLQQGHIINISSTSAWWSSFPDIDSKRFFYNISKYNLSEFGRQFNRKIVNDSKNVVVSTLELGRFESKLSEFTGQKIENIVEQINLVIKSKCHNFSKIN